MTETLRLKPNSLPKSDRIHMNQMLISMVRKLKHWLILTKIRTQTLSQKGPSFETQECYNLNLNINFEYNSFDISI